MRPFYAIAGVVALTIAVYAAVIGFSFVSYDDLTYVAENPYVMSGGGNPLTFVWSANWHPLTWASHRLDVVLFGPNPGMHHFVNLILHCLITVLVFRVVVRLGFDGFVACLVAALFAVHPMHVESVAWVSERKDLLCALFWMLTILAYVWYAERRSLPRYFVVFLMFTLGAMSKPMIVTLPIVLILVDYLRGEVRIRDKLLFFGMVAAHSLLTLHAQTQAIDTVFTTWSERALSVPVHYVWYLKKLVFPSGLSILYPNHGMPGPEAVGLSVFIMLSLTVMVFGSRRRWVVFGWLWFLVTIFPVSGIVQVGVQSTADRYTYISYVGPFLVLSRWAWEAFRHRLKTVGAVAFAVALGLSIVAQAQVGVWKNSRTLYLNALKHTQGNWLVLNNLAAHLLDQRELDTAENLLIATLSINPFHDLAWCNLAGCKLIRGELDASKQLYETAVAINPHLEEGWYGVWVTTKLIRKRLNQFDRI